jgi:hypothetical protein
MRKGITLLTVLLLPITIYLIFAISTIHYVRVPHFGPRTTHLIKVKGKTKTDTVFHSIGAFAYPGVNGMVKSDTLLHRLYLACLVNADSGKNGYNCAALKAYYKFNKGELDTLHFVFFFPHLSDSNKVSINLADSLGLPPNHTLTFFPDSNDLNYLRRDNYFKPDPQAKSKVNPWKTTNDLVLIDTHGNVRGYYDGRYAPEITRVIEDIKHIKFHDEAVGMEEKYTPRKRERGAESEERK